jgi:DNA repair protein RadD
MLEQCLLSLNIGELSELIGGNTVEALDNIGISANKSNLVEVILETSGINVLNSRGNRLIFFKKENIIKDLDLSEAQLRRFKSAPWKNCRDEIASLLNIDTSLFSGELEDRPDSFDTEVDYALMPYQNWIRKRVLDHFNRNLSKRALVHMPTGAGKTSTAMQIIFDHLRASLPHNTTVVWMAHSDELCEQAIQSFARAWPAQSLGKARLWRAWGGQSDLEDFEGVGCNFVVTSFQTLFSWQRTPKNKIFANVNRLKRNCDFLVVDEAHLSTAPTYASAIEYVSGFNSKIMGLTATPGRHYADGEDTPTNELVAFYEDNLITMTNDIGETLADPIGFLQSKRVLSDIELKPIPGSDVTLSKAELLACKQLFDLTENVLSNLGSDSKRTLNISREVLLLARDNELPTIVFCPSKSNAIVMAEYLKLNGCSTVAITGDTDSEIRRASLQKFKEGKLRVITNYGVLTTGFDAPNIGAVVIARPTQSIVLYSQMIGRGLRGPLFGGTENCIVLNVEDNIMNLPDYKSASTYFNEYYSENRG